MDAHETLSGVRGSVGGTVFDGGEQVARERGRFVLPFAAGNIGEGVGVVGRGRECGVEAFGHDGASGVVKGAAEADAEMLEIFGGTATLGHVFHQANETTECDELAGRGAPGRVARSKRCEFDMEFQHVGQRGGFEPAHAGALVERDLDEALRFETLEGGAHDRAADRVGGGEFYFAKREARRDATQENG